MIDRSKAVEKYVNRILEYLPVKPIASDVLRGIMKFLGKITADKRCVEKVGDWAKELRKVST